jgi:hypothetical protein
MLTLQSLYYRIKGIFGILDDIGAMLQLETIMISKCYKRKNTNG